MFRIRKLIFPAFLVLVFGTCSLAGDKKNNYFNLPELSLKEKNKNSLSYSISEKLPDVKFRTSKISIDQKPGLLQLSAMSLTADDLDNREVFDNDGSSILAKQPDYLSEQYLKKIVNNHEYWESKKRLGVVVGELVIVELIPWAISKWITRPGWANVGWQSWWHNIQEGFEYDGDNFLTNNFAHPYHGNLYFNTARTNGYNFWESMPFAFTGSLLWEYLGEYYRPSFNDWINTSVSGINLGEMTYRVANLITDNTTRGSDRVWTEIFGALVNPVRGFNRLISGEASKVHPNTELFEMPVRLFVDGGMRRVVKSGSDFLGDSVSTEGLLGFDFLYGKGYGSDLGKPFSNFRVWGHISNGSSKLTDLYSYGVLTGWKLGGKEKNRQLFTINLAYNFLTNPAYEFGGPGVLFNFNLKNMVGEKLYFSSDLGLYAILMGSTSTEYFYGEDGRDYDFGPGPGILLSTNLTDGNWRYLSLIYQGYTIFTMSGSPESKHYLHNGTISTTLPINNYFAIGADFTVFWRNSFYKTEEDVSRTSPIGRFFFVTKL